MKRADCDQAYLAVGKLEYLQRLRKFDQLDDVIGENLLGTYREIDREAVISEDFLMCKIVGGADAGDPGRRVKERRCQFARDEIGLIAARDGKNQVGIRGAGCGEHRRVRGVADDRAQIEAVLQLFQAHRIDVDDRDVIGFGTQAFGHRRSDLACAENDDFQSSRLPG